MIRKADGRWGRYYFYDRRSDPVCVTYHRKVGKRLRQLTVSPKLLRRVLRSNPGSGTG